MNGIRFLLLASLCAASQVHAQEIETYEYTVQPGDSCASIARRLFGDRRRWDLIHQYNPNMGPTPHDLQAGSILLLPRPQLAPDAQVTAARRDVQARQPSATDWRRAATGLDLFRGWRVNTLDESSAELTFRDESQVQMRANTLVIIYGGEASRARRTATTRAELQRGTLRSRLGELRLQVDTPGAETRLEGGAAVVSVDEEGTARVSNHDGGAAEVRGEGGRRVRVRPGFGSQVRRQRPPSPPRPLPPAPAWVDGPVRFGGLASEGGSIHGEWTAVDDARIYRVEIRRRGETALVAAAEVPANVQRMEVHRLPAGEYEVTLATIDNDLFESRPSDTRAMQVDLFRLEGQDGAPDPLAPYAIPRTPLGARLNAPEHACTTGDEAGSSDLMLAEPGPIRVRCTAADGTELAPFALEVAQLDATFEEGAPSLAGQEGEAIDQRFTLTSDAPLPELTWSADGLEGLSVQGSDGAYRVQIAAAVAGEYTLVGARDGVGLVHIPLVVAAADAPEPEVAPPAAEERPAPIGSDGLAVFRHPSVLGVRDTRPGVFAANFGFGSSGDAPFDDGAFTRLAVGIEADVAGRARLVVAGHPRLEGDTAGDDDLFAGVGIHFGGDCGDEPCLGLYGELAAWFPIPGLGAESDEMVVLAPSVTLSFGATDFLLRTRQGALIATEDGLRGWASAYGFDVRIAGPLFAGLEANFTLGRDSRTDEFITHLGAGGTLGVALRRARLGLTFQRAMSDDLRNARGDHLVVLSARTTFGTP